jgi:hypothetical protein
MSATAKNVRRLTPRERRLLMIELLSVLLVLGFVADAVVFTAPGGGGPADLSLSTDAASFGHALRTEWLESSRSGLCGLGAVSNPDGDSIMSLRCGLFADSILFVPGYAGFLVLFTLLLAGVVEQRWPLYGGLPRAERERYRQTGRKRFGLTPSDWRVLGVHALCFVPVVAAFLDIAENGMTARAGDDWLQSVLADATVVDVRLASLGKWAFIAASFALLGVLAFVASGAARPEERRILGVSGAVALATGALFAAGAWIARPLLFAGFAGALATFAVLVIWQARLARVEMAGQRR